MNCVNLLGKSVDTRAVTYIYRFWSISSRSIPFMVILLHLKLFSAISECNERPWKKRKRKTLSLQSNLFRIRKFLEWFSHIRVTGNNSCSSLRWSVVRRSPACSISARWWLITLRNRVGLLTRCLAFRDIFDMALLSPWRVLARECVAAVPCLLDAR